MDLRPYQQESTNKAWAWMRKSLQPALLEAATGAGKSHVIAALAELIHKNTGKRVLCLAPRAKLVSQNLEKYRHTGNDASIYSASLGRKCLRHPVVFGTPGTVVNSIDRFGGEFALVIIDEAHKTTGTVIKIIEGLRMANSKLRVIGLTATPYVMGRGHIYALDVDGNPIRTSKEPYFLRLLHSIKAPELIEQGYLTPPVVGDIGTSEYDTDTLVMGSNGLFTADSIAQTYTGLGRLTADIIADVVKKSQGRGAVFIFAASSDHVRECMASLPPEHSAAILSGTNKKERERIFAAVACGDVKYLVSINVLTEGVDEPSVGVVALLRRTESRGLLQQMIGRGTRQHKGKTDFLILDYAGNLKEHIKGGNIFSPVVMAPKDTRGPEIKATCPRCAAVNLFAKKVHKSFDGLGVNVFGYFTDLRGAQLPIPAHYGRRCGGFDNKTGIQCGHMWVQKECKKCGHNNDIAARKCKKCKAELVNPNDKLSREAAIIEDNKPKTAVVVGWSYEQRTSRAKNKCVVVNFRLEGRRNINIWFVTTEGKDWSYKRLLSATDGLKKKPQRITYKRSDAGFYNITGYE